MARAITACGRTTNGKTERTVMLLTPWNLSTLVPVIALTCCLSLFTQPVKAVEIAGVKVPDSIELSGQSLALNGAGLRTKAIIKLYVGALYLSEPSGDANAIIASEDPMAIWLRIRSGLLSQKKMAVALLDGFENSTGGNTAPIQSEIDQLLALMKEPIVKKDRYTLAWDPAVGTRVSKNDKELGVIPGLEFKQALFGIWLSAKPAQGKLKQAMLGG